MADHDDAGRWGKNVRPDTVDTMPLIEIRTLHAVRPVLTLGP
jgi:hypothetical protein